VSIARCKTVLGTEDGHTVHTEPSPKHTEAAEGQQNLTEIDRVKSDGQEKHGKAISAYIPIHPHVPVIIISHMIIIRFHISCLRTVASLQLFLSKNGFTMLYFQNLSAAYHDAYPSLGLQR